MQLVIDFLLFWFHTLERFLPFKYFLHPYHLEWRMHKGKNSNYHTIPEILQGVDFSVNQIDVINVSLKYSHTVTYGQGPNFLTMLLVFMAFYAVFSIFASHPSDGAHYDEAADDFFTFPILSNSIFSTSVIRDDRTLFENHPIILDAPFENELDEETSRHEDIPTPEEFFDGDDHALYEDLPSYFDEDAYADIYMHNDFRQLGSQLYVSPYVPERSKAQYGAISDPSYWAQTGLSSRTHPRASMDRMRESSYWKVEELFNAGDVLPLYPHRVVRPGTLAGKGAFTFDEHIENAKADPFHLLDFTPPLVDESDAQAFAEDIAEDTEGWYPEAYIHQDFFEEVFLDQDIDYRYNQIIPDEWPAFSVSLDGNSILFPLLKLPPRDAYTKDQAREILFLDPPDEPLFEYVDSDDPFSVVDSLPLSSPEYSSLSHNFDYGTYYAPVDFQPDMQPHLFSAELRRDVETLNILTNSSYGSSAEAQFFDSLLEARGFFSLFPSREVLYCADIARLNEDLFSELAGLEAQVVALKQVFDGDEPFFSVETLPLAWDYQKASWVVFNYSSNKWLRVTDFLGWAEQRVAFLLGEVTIPKGAANTLYHKSKDLFKFSWFYDFLIHVKSRFVFSLDSLLILLSHSLWYDYIVVRPLRSFMMFARSFAPFLISSRSLHKDYYPFIMSWEYPIVSALLHALPRRFKEGVIDNTVYGDIFPYEERREELVEPAYGVPAYPYWLRLGVFNTMDYIDSVDHYDPADPTWLSRCYELSAEEFEPFLSVTDIDFVRSYYLDTPREFKRLVQKFKIEAMYIYPFEQEPRIMARMHDNVSMLLPRDHFFIRDAKMIDPLKVNRVILKIVGYDFADYNIFRHVTNDQVKDILKEQPFEKDHIIERDLTAKYTAEEKLRARKKTAQLRIRIARMIQANEFTPVGRLETRFIHIHDHKPYVRLKYIDTPPKKMPKRRRIFRRF